MKLFQLLLIAVFSLSILQANLASAGTREGHRKASKYIRTLPAKRTPASHSKKGKRKPASKAKKAKKSKAKKKSPHKKAKKQHNYGA